tara:strand:- start:572 stop:904 length:333 start_codon:yes stop_codon:yes gene_type:complete
MTPYEKGDLVCFKWPGQQVPLRIGIVIEATTSTFSVKWIWYDKFFYMEDAFDEAKELNKKFILDIVQYKKKSNNICIEILSPAISSYRDEPKTDRHRTSKEDNSTDCGSG